VAAQVTKLRMAVTRDSAALKVIRPNLVLQNPCHGLNYVDFSGLRNATSHVQLRDAIQRSN
jgi:hypothetical protein